MRLLLMSLQPMITECVGLSSTCQQRSVIGGVRVNEALEQQQVSISKANIQATLRAETTVLPAANPKFGRFDPYEMISKQILKQRSQDKGWAHYMDKLRLAGMHNPRSNYAR